MTHLEGKYPVPAALKYSHVLEAYHDTAQISTD